MNLGRKPVKSGISEPSRACYSWDRRVASILGTGKGGTWCICVKYRQCGSLSIKAADEPVPC